MVASRYQRRGVEVVTAGHTSRVKGVGRFIDELADWQELDGGWIRLGRISGGRPPGRYSGRRKSSGSRASERKLFDVVGLARVGEIITGVRCAVRDGHSSQDVVLQPRSARGLNVLIRRLREEGYCCDKGWERDMQQPR